MALKLILTQKDIETARSLAKWANEFAPTDADRIEERLFRTKDGRLFVHRASGAADARLDETRILGDDEAKAWVRERCDERTFRRLFGTA